MAILNCLSLEDCVPKHKGIKPGQIPFSALLPALLPFLKWPIPGILKAAVTSHSMASSWARLKRVAPWGKKHRCKACLHFPYSSKNNKQLLIPICTDVYLLGCGDMERTTMASHSVKNCCYLVF